jgi:hypothetical protein
VKHLRRNIAVQGLSQVQERPNPQPPSHLWLTLPYSWEGKGKTFTLGRGLISKPLSRVGERFTREVKTVPHTSENRYIAVQGLSAIQSLVGAKACPQYVPLP